MHQPAPPPDRGFTVVEMVISMLALAVMAVGAGVFITWLAGAPDRWRDDRRADLADLVAVDHDPADVERLWVGRYGDVAVLLTIDGQACRIDGLIDDANQITLDPAVCGSDVR